MLNEILENMNTQLLKKEFNDIKNRTIHLGVFTEPYLSLMLNGVKTIESRFSKNKILPYNQISKNDIVIIKKSGGQILGYLYKRSIVF